MFLGIAKASAVLIPNGQFDQAVFRPEFQDPRIVIGTKKNRPGQGDQPDLDLGTGALKKEASGCQEQRLIRYFR